MNDIDLKEKKVHIMEGEKNNMGRVGLFELRCRLRLEALARYKGQGRKVHLLRPAWPSLLQRREEPLYALHQKGAFGT